MTESQILRILTQMNMTLLEMKKLISKMEKDGIKVRTQESHA